VLTAVPYVATWILGYWALARRTIQRTMSADTNKAMIPRLVEEVWRRGNVGVIDELLRPTGWITTLYPACPHRQISANGGRLGVCQVDLWPCSPRSLGEQSHNFGLSQRWHAPGRPTNAAEWLATLSPCESLIGRARYGTSGLASELVKGSLTGMSGHSAQAVSRSPTIFNLVGSGSPIKLAQSFRADFTSSDLESRPRGTQAIRGDPIFCNPI
jgi:hypothetical protein